MAIINLRSRTVDLDWVIRRDSVAALPDAQLMVVGVEGRRHIAEDVRRIDDCAGG
jgi:hypothetical protein